MAEDHYSFSSSDKGNLNYEGTFNMHIQRTNFLITQINMKEGIGIYALLPFYTAITTLDGLVQASYATEEYKSEIKKKLLMVREKMDLRKVAGANNAEQYQVMAWFDLCDIWAYQINQMNTIGLVPPKDVDDVLPSIVEKVGKVIEVPPWKPGIHDFDYKRELGIIPEDSPDAEAEPSLSP